MQPHRSTVPAMLLAALIGWPVWAAPWDVLVDDLQELRREGSVPALGLVILDGDRPAFIRALGEATPDTPFRWGSITKTFTALAVLTLAEQHDLPLTTPIRPLLGADYYRNRWRRTNPVRLIDLLELTAGFPDLNGAEFNDNIPLPLGKALSRYAASRETLWPPGLQHSYSNFPAGLAAAVVEQISGRRFESHINERVFEPLGMTNASLSPVAGLPGGFKADGKTEISYWHMTFTSFGSLNASLTEMTNFLIALLDDGKLRGRQALPSAAVAQLFTPTASLGAKHGLRLSYGSGAYGWARGGHLFWGHGGDADGYRSRYGLLRDHRRAYLLVINTDNARLLGRMRRLVEDALIAGLPADPSPPTAEIELGDYAGSYYPSSVRFGAERWRRGDALAIEVREAAGRLVVDRAGRQTDLLPVGPGHFIRHGDPVVSVVFASGPDGHIFMQGELGNFIKIASNSCPEFLLACK